MSTKKISEALKMLEGVLDHPNMPAGFDGVLERARAELEAIRKAAKTLDRLHVGIFTYNIRDRSTGDTGFTGNPWEHPDVKAWSDASVLMGAIANEEP